VVDTVRTIATLIASSADNTTGNWTNQNERDLIATLQAMLGNVVVPEAYGAVGNGSTDDTTAINNAIAAVVANGGGTVLFGAKRYLMNSDMVIPFTVGPNQPPIRLTGQGPWMPGSWGLTVTGGTQIDIRGTGNSGAHVAKIDTRGFGVLEIDHMTIMSGGSDNFPIFQTTNTTVNLHDLSFYGNPNNSGTACLQTALRIGGQSTSQANIGTSGATDAYNAFGSQLNNLYFDHIRHCVEMGSDVNSLPMTNLTVGNTCGSAETLGAPIMLIGGGWGCWGNTIGPVLAEVTNYPYAVNMTCAVAGQDHRGNIFNISLWDPGGSTVGGVYCGTSTLKNLITIGFTPTALFAKNLDGPTAGSNTLVAHN
jgi:hypothetical protein